MLVGFRREDGAWEDGGGGIEERRLMGWHELAYHYPVTNFGGHCWYARLAD